MGVSCGASAIVRETVEKNGARVEGNFAVIALRNAVQRVAAAFSFDLLGAHDPRF
jgi:hypothetical protein